MLAATSLEHAVKPSLARDFASMLRLLAPCRAKMAVSARYMATKVVLHTVCLHKPPALPPPCDLKTSDKATLPADCTYQRVGCPQLHVQPQVSVANVKELRKLTALPMKLCREALQQGDDDVQAAMAWLDNNEEARAQ